MGGRHRQLVCFCAVAAKGARPVPAFATAVANPALNDLASRIQELTREKHRLYQSIHTRQALLFG